MRLEAYTVMPIRRMGPREMPIRCTFAIEHLIEHRESLLRTIPWLSQATILPVTRDTEFMVGCLTPLGVEVSSDSLVLLPTASTLRVRDRHGVYDASIVSVRYGLFDHGYVTDIFKRSSTFSHGK